MPSAENVPGTFGTWMLLLRDYGTMKPRDVLEAAIGYARDGFQVDQRYRQMAETRLEMLQTATPASKLFLDGGTVPDRRHPDPDRRRL